MNFHSVVSIILVARYGTCT